MISQERKGFTLIELLVVVAIIGTLTGLATVNFQDARERARDAQRKGDVKQIQKAMELYKNDQSAQHYPDDADPTETWREKLEAGGYMNNVPRDPKAQAAGSSWPDYQYDRSSVLEYTLVTCLENPADPDIDETNTCDSGYSYTLTQP